MNLLKITDLKNGKIQVSYQCGNVSRQCPDSLPFTDPLTQEDRKELRWYLEKYLRFPYGAEEYRARKVEENMEKWGASLFKQVFPQCDTSPDPRTLYQEAVRQGLGTCEICIVSEDTKFLNIPWELLRDPTPGRGYLAPLVGGFYRQRIGLKVEVPPERREGPFRILLVICRPYGKRDVPFGTVARPMLEALRPLRRDIHLEVLRPPTFDVLTETLNANRGFYHVVHFDGHGVFAPPSSSSSSTLHQFGVGESRGYLVFEKEDGTADVISSKDLGQALAASKVPLFVLNACQSAEEGGEDPYSSVASQLVAAGARGVVAMSYSVYAEAASLFMQRFYETLVEHKPLAEAVAAGRRRLHTTSGRACEVGEIKLQDWMVPTLYQQEYTYTPLPDVTMVSEQVPEPALEQAQKACPEGQFGFIGRDYDILRVERAFHDDESPWVLLTGVGGTGKTELAYGFARWYAETGGCPGGVFCTSFREKADFGQVIGSIAGFGTDFSRLPDEEQWRRIVGYLREYSCLLVWDNVEPVAGYPQGAVPLATEEERETLSRFLSALRGGKTRVLITTRKPGEEWLRIAYTLVEVTGLTEWDAGELAKVILRKVGRRPEDFRDDPDYARLLRLLKGHPRSLEVVLPHLRRRSPAEIIEALQHRVSSGNVLDASHEFVVAQLSEKARKHLPFIGLFTSYVLGEVAGLISGAEGYREVMGEPLDAAGWRTILEEAALSGLIRPVGEGLYELHPTLPSFLQQNLAKAVGEEGLERLDVEFMRFYGRFAASLFENVRRSDPNALAAVSVEEANLLRALRLAEMREEWGTAGVIVQTLGEFYEARGRVGEWSALRTRVLGRVGREMSADAEGERASLWMYLLGSEANHAMGRNDLEAAEAAHQRILNYLLSLHDSGVEPNIAVGYHQLGMIAEERQQFDLAGQWYRKALEIRERLGLERDAADDYHQLGIIAQERQQFDVAEQWYRKALEIKERLNHPPLLVDTLAQFGLLRKRQNRLPESVQWLGKALAIAAEYKMHVGGQILVDLARLMETMGEEEFTTAWKTTFREEPPIALLREIREKLKKG